LPASSPGDKGDTFPFAAKHEAVRGDDSAVVSDACAGIEFEGCSGPRGRFSLKQVYNIATTKIVNSNHQIKSPDVMM
jgi:hypothetical protein